MCLFFFFLLFTFLLFVVSLAAVVTNPNNVCEGDYGICCKFFFLFSKVAIFPSFHTWSIVYLSLIVFPFLISPQTVTRDHLNKASRVALRRVQTLVIIKLNFVILCQGEELQMKNKNHCNKRYLANKNDGLQLDTFRLVW